jgi:hypothetical protein
MPIWVDGEARRGYKRAQFADAFLRVLGVRSVRTVRDEWASEAAPNAPNAANASVTEGGTNGPIPVYPGDPDFPEPVDLAFHEGRATKSEWLERRKVHALVIATGSA